MLTYFVCCKALSPAVLGNEEVRSGNESMMSEEGSHKNSMQATIGMAKLMNLINNQTVPPWTFAPLLLMGNVGYEFLPESELTLDTVDLCHFSPILWLQGPNPIHGEDKRTLALPKGRKSYGKGAAIVENLSDFEGQQVTRRKKDTHIIPQEGCVKLLELRSQNNEKSLHKLIHYIADIQTLTLAYELIKSKPGNMTPGITQETLDGISLSYLFQLSKEIRSGKFQFTPARRIWIPKPGKTEKRPLGIASPREKIVQKAIELVLSSIYEPVFLETSHGFRPNKSTHSALQMIDIRFKGAVWFIEADITKCFDCIYHERLIKKLSEKITCRKTLALIRSGLNVGYVELGGIAEKALMGTPQGSVLSPLLCNIFLHELDKYMNDLSAEYDKGVKRRQNPTYTAILNKMAKQNLSGKIQLRKELRKFPIGDPMDPHFVRIRYVRYADDFLISIIGPYSLAIEIKNKVSQFLEDNLGLEMNQAKTLITKASQTPAHFLGANIIWRNPSEKKVVINKHKKKTRITARMGLLAPLDKLIKKLVERGFAKWNPNGTIKPIGLKRMQNMNHADIISYYNAVTRGVLNYYSFTDNRSSLGSWVRYLHMSCARTLALKYKLRFMAKAFKKFGSLLRCPETGTKLYKPNNLNRIRQFHTSKPPTLMGLGLSWANKLTRSNLGKECIICGATPVEMHHVRKIKELKSRQHLNWFTIQMAAINRKQVPLCGTHHTKLHNDKLTPEERKLYVVGCKALISKNKSTREC